MTDIDTLPTTDQSPRLIKTLARRRFLRGSAQMGVAAGGLALLGACGGSSDSTATPTPTPTATSTSTVVDADALNLLLNLEYLQAQFFMFATTGTNISAIASTSSQANGGLFPGGGAALLTGTGTQGSVTGGRAVSFASTTIGQYAREIAADDLAHLRLLRSILGTAAVAQPALNIDGGTSGAFTKIAQLAGYAASGATFDPYASDLNFLLAAFVLKDLAVTAMKGVTTLLTSTTYLDAVAGMLATQAYHAALVRTTLYTMSAGTAAGQFSDARDGLDGSTDIDQGITGTASTANITPVDANGRVYTRTSGQVLNVLYLNSAAVTSGGFLPSGTNGNTRTSAASNA